MSGISVPKSWQSYKIPNFGGGLNISNAQKKPNEVSDGLNYDLTREGVAVKRGGSHRCNASALAITDDYYSMYQTSLRIAGVVTEYWLGNYDTKLFKAVTDVADKLKINSFSDIKTALTNDKFRWATLANKAIAFSIKNSPLWTDGTTVYNLGVAAPLIPVAAENGTGTMAAGKYYVGYSYYRDGNFDYETNVGPSKDVTIVANRSIDIDVTESIDPQIDKIRVYCSTLGGTILYWVKDVVNTTATINMDVTAPSGYEAPLDNFVPPKAKFVMVKNNRLIVAYTDDTDIGSSVVRWSNPNQPEAFGVNSYKPFDPEDSDEITGLGSLLNFIVVFKGEKVFLLDAQNLDDGDFLQISTKHGCIAPDSIETVLNGKAIVYLSLEGVALFDGKNDILLDRDKIDIVFKESMDKTKVYDWVQSIYSPVERRYSIAVPITAGYRWYNYYFDASGWMEYDIFESKMFILAKSQTDNIVVVGIDRVVNNLFFKEIDYGQDDDGSTIKTKLKTIPYGLGEGIESFDKTVRRAYVGWLCSDANNAAFMVTTDFGTKPGSTRTYSHVGASHWGNFYWTPPGLGPPFWGSTGREIDRVDLSNTGKTFEFCIEEESKASVIIYSIEIFFYMITLTGVED